MNTIDKLVSLLRDDNVEQLKSEICALLINAIQTDLDSYLSNNYISD